MQVRSRVTRSGHNTPHQVNTLGPVGGGANAAVAVGVASWADYGRWAQEGLPTISNSNHWIKGRRYNGYYTTTTRVTQMHDIVKTLQDGQKSFGVRARGWEKSLRKHGKTTMTYRITRPLQQVVTISVEAKTFVCERSLPCPPLVLLPLCTPPSPYLLQAPRCQTWIHHAHHCNKCEVASPQVEAIQARHGPVCLKQLLRRTDES